MPDINEVLRWIGALGRVLDHAENHGESYAGARDDHEALRDLHSTLIEGADVERSGGVVDDSADSRVALDPAAEGAPLSVAESDPSA